LVVAVDEVELVMFEFVELEHDYYYDYYINVVADAVFKIGNYYDPLIAQFEVDNWIAELEFVEFVFVAELEIEVVFYSAFVDYNYYLHQILFEL